MIVRRHRGTTHSRFVNIAIRRPEMPLFAVFPPADITTSGEKYTGVTGRSRRSPGNTRHYCIWKRLQREIIVWNLYLCIDTLIYCIFIHIWRIKVSYGIMDGSGFLDSLVKEGDFMSSFPVPPVDFPYIMKEREIRKNCTLNAKNLLHYTGYRGKI